MTNIEMSREGDKLTLTIDLSKKGPKSRSGKSTIIATTGGNIRIPESDNIKLGLNLYEVNP